MSLKPLGSYNNISEEMKAKIANVKPKRGKVASFRVLNKEADPIANKGKPIDVYPNLIQIPAFSEYSETNAKGETTYIRIGFMSGIDKDGVPIFDKAHRNKLQFYAAKNGGRLDITLDGSLGDAFFEFLMLSSFVSDNLLTTNQRQPGIRPVFQFINEVAESRKKLNTQTAKYEAIAIGQNLPTPELDRMCQLLGIDHRRRQEVKRADLCQYAETNTDSFMAAYNDPFRAEKAAFIEAVNLNVLRIDPLEKMVYWADGRELLKVSSAKTVDAAKDFAHWYNKDADAKAMLVTINKECKSAKNALFAKMKEAGQITEEEEKEFLGHETPVNVLKNEAKKEEVKKEEIKPAA